MNKMASEIRTGSDEAGSSTEVVAFTDSLHVGAKSFKRDGANNFLFYDGSVTHTLIHGTVDSLEYTYPVVRSPGDTLKRAVGIHLALRDVNLQVSVRATIALRN
jgi:prepilin-type processing-associated H-X9-DG protein